MPERTQLNININPDLLKNLKKIALENTWNNLTSKVVSPNKSNHT